MVVSFSKHTWRSTKDQWNPVGYTQHPSLFPRLAHVLYGNRQWSRAFTATVIAILFLKNLQMWFRVLILNKTQRKPTTTNELSTDCLVTRSSLLTAEPHLLKTHQWATLWHWVTGSFTASNTGTGIYSEWFIFHVQHPDPANTHWSTRRVLIRSCK